MGHELKEEKKPLAVVKQGILDEFVRSSGRAIMEILERCRKLKEQGFVPLHVGAVREVLNKETGAALVSLEVATDIFANIECPTDLCCSCGKRLFITTTDFVAVKVEKVRDGDLVVGVKGYNICDCDLCHEFECVEGLWRICGSEEMK